MKKFRYTAGLKIILVVLQQIFAVILVVSIVLLSALFGKKMLDTNNMLNKSFTDSGYYADVFRQSVQEVLRYATLKQQFEIDGVYDEDKNIDIVAYANGRFGADKLQDDEDPERLGMKYRLKDLVNWSDSGYSLDESGMLVESFTPLSGKSIHQSLTDGTMDYDEAMHTCQMVEQTLDNIRTDINLYKRYLNKYDVNDSNVKYWISTGLSTHIYSNMNQEDAGKEVEKAVEGVGSYFYYDDTSLHLKTNVTGMEDYFYNNLNTEAGAIGNSPIILVSVDTTFPYQDTLSDARNEFMKYHPWMIAGMFILAFGLISWIMTLVLLTMAAGRTEVEDEIRTNWVDKIKTEIIFGALMLFVVLATVITVQLLYGNWKIPGMLIMAGTMAYVCDSVFLVFYLSLVRRMKAEILWKNSLIYWLISSAQKLIFNWRITARLMAAFVVGNALFFAVTYLLCVKKSVFAGILLIGMLVWNAHFMLKEAIQRGKIIEGVNKIAEGDLTFKIEDEGFYGSNKNLAVAVNNIGEGLYSAVDENTKNERMKADLITNVSHDIKTPLTSIINYVNLIKREHIEDEKLKGYVDILDAKAQRLRQLTEDLVEASKISSGNIELHMQCINFVELVYQTGGEFNEKFEAKDLTTITKLPQEPVFIMADGRRIWRVVENLYNNVAKYALAHTRVYVTMEVTDKEMEFSIKNISEQEIKVDTTELTERFIRGDVARTTEGSGLGLSIAKNLTVLMDGKFSIDLDGDLFKASVRFPRVAEQES